MTKILVTGASGRFGQYMVQALRGDYDLKLTSRKPVPADRADLPWVQGDLNDYEACQRAVEGVQAIMHLGAVPSPSDHPALIARSVERDEPLLPLDATMRTNIIGTYNLMMASVQEGVETVVMTGSNCAFGMGYRISDRPFPIDYLPLDEQHPSDVEDSYSYSKLVGEELLASFTRAYGIRTYVTRPGGICTPERLQRMAESVTPAKEWSQWMWGYVPSVDLAAMQRMIMEQAEDLAEHDVFVANGLDTSLLEPTLDMIARLRPDLLPLADNLKGHQALFSTAKAQGLLGWTPSQSWRDYLSS